MFLELQHYSSLIGQKPAGFTEHYYTEWDSGLEGEKIALFLVLAIGSTQIPGTEIGKEAFQLLQDHFLDDLEGDPYQRFEAALKEVNLMIADKEKKLDIKFVPNVNVICGVLQKDDLFLSQRGEAQGYLVRKRHVSSITDDLYDPKNKEDLFQNIASGRLEVGDSVVLATGPLVQYLAPSDFAKLFSENPLHEAGAQLKDLLGADVEDQMALLALEVLEKSHDVRLKNDESDLEVLKNEPSDEASEMPKNPRQKRLMQSLNVLRDTVASRGNFAALGKFSEKFKHLGQKRLLMLIGGGITVLVLGLLVLKVTTGQQRLMEEMQEKLVMAEENIAQAQTRGSFDKAEASTLLSGAESLAVQVLNSEVLRAQASAVLDEIAEQRDTLDRVVRVDEELKLLADFTDLLGTGSIQGTVLYQDHPVVYTETEAYDVLVDQVQSPVPLVTGDLVQGAEYFSDRDLILMFTQSGQLIEYEGRNAQLADTADVTFQKAVSLATYSSKVYFLDPSKGQIWKYQRGTSGYGAAQAYLPEASTLDLSDAVSLAIDGNVWILKSDGTIVQLLSGEEVDFKIQKAPLNALEGATKIVTSLDMNQVYVLDAKGKRLMVYLKDSKSNDLVYEAQYVFDSLKGELRDFYFDRDRNVMVLLTESALYEWGFGS